MPTADFSVFRHGMCTELGICYSEERLGPTGLRPASDGIYTHQSLLRMTAEKANGDETA